MTPEQGDVETPEGWERQGDSIEKTFEFADFETAMSFMAKAVAPINELNHHPTWTNTYNQVHVELSSHDVGAITGRDVRLAAILDSLAERH